MRVLNNYEKAYISKEYMLFWCQNETSMWVCVILLCDGNDVYADSIQ